MFKHQHLEGWLVQAPAAGQGCYLDGLAPGKDAWGHSEHGTAVSVGGRGLKYATTREAKACLHLLEIHFEGSKLRQAAVVHDVNTR